MDPFQTIDFGDLLDVSNFLDEMDDIDIFTLSKALDNGENTVGSSVCESNIVFNEPPCEPPSAVSEGTVSESNTVFNEPSCEPPSAVSESNVVLNEPPSASASDEPENDRRGRLINEKRPTFIEVSGMEKDQFIEKMKNKNTVRKTEQSIRLFKTWLENEPRYDTREPWQIPASELDNYIGSFILSIRKSDGEEYEPDTLTSYHRGIDRSLRENHYPFSIITDKEFLTSRTVLASKRKELKQKGKGNKPNRAEPITMSEEKLLMEKGCLGNNSPKQLLNRMWFNNTVLFGLRGGDENRQLKWGDISLKRDADDNEYLEYNERITKTRTGASSKHNRSFNPKQYEAKENPENCPVQAYKIYRSHRPNEMCHDEAPFYLAINHQRRASGNWYKNNALGENSLRNIMKTMATEADLPGRKTNHSARKTTCTKLLHAGIAPTVIQQLTGHKNTQSVNNYAAASNDMQREMSNILSNNVQSSIPSPHATRSICNRENSTPNSIQISCPTFAPSYEYDQATTTSNTNSSNEQYTGPALQNARLMNCTVTINNNYNTLTSRSPEQKRYKRIRVIESDTDSE